jgi:hypothetical protein
MEILKWIFLIPLAIVGGISVIRGWCKTLIQDIENIKFKHAWQVGLFLMLEVWSLFALVYTLINLFA